MYFYCYFLELWGLVCPTWLEVKIAVRLRPFSAWLHTHITDLTSSQRNPVVLLRVDKTYLKYIQRVECIFRVRWRIEDCRIRDESRNEIRVKFLHKISFKGEYFYFYIIRHHLLWIVFIITLKFAIMEARSVATPISIMVYYLEI